jgi:methionyl-tRNA synthetase
MCGHITPTCVMLLMPASLAPMAADYFGRTPTRAQTEICQSIFHSVYANGGCVEQSMEQLYSEAAGKFLADRFVSGTCPKCGYDVSGNRQCRGVVGW